VDLNLRNKVAIVTGGSKGIGLGIVRSLLAEGCRVINVNRSAEDGLRLEAEYAAQGQECVFVQGDLTQVSACENAVQTALERFGQIDILVNNAGVNDGAGLTAGVDAFVTSLQRNLIHYYAMAHLRPPRSRLRRA